MAQPNLKNRRSPLPVPGTTRQAPYQGQTIRRGHGAESRHGNDSHWYREQGTPHSLPSVATIPGIIDKSKALLNWHQRFTLSKLHRHLLDYLNQEAR